MRFFEIITEEKYNGLDNFVTLLQNLVGRYTSKRQQAPFNWEAVAQMAKKSEFEVLGDPDTGYEIFKSLWDKNPKAKKLLEPLVKNFNSQGIELNIPGAPDAEEPEQSQGQTSQDMVDKAAAGAAAGQLAQSQSTPKI
jgi:hypothetical protein